MRTDFGAFTLDDDRRLLLRDGEPVHLTLKAYELLRLLVRERPRVISKAELHERLWPDTFVSDATLAGLVKALRASLGVSGRRSPLLRTVHGFGYGFGGTAVDRESAPASKPAAARSAETRFWLAGEERQFDLHEGEHVIGRDAEASIQLDWVGVSRRHARVFVTDSTVTIEDLDSKNGTFVQGKRIDRPMRLADRDEIRVGSTPLTFRVQAPAMSTQTLE